MATKHVDAEKVEAYTRALMEAALDRCPHAGVVLIVLEDNARAIGFYEHMGFSLTGRTFTDGVLREAEMLLMR